MHARLPTVHNVLVAFDQCVSFILVSLVVWTNSVFNFTIITLGCTDILLSPFLLCRPWRLIVLATAHPDISFAVVSDVETLVLRHCYKKDNTMSWCGGDHKVYMYPDVLRTSQFCLVLNHASTELLDVMMMVCRFLNCSTELFSVTSF